MVKKKHAERNRRNWESKKSAEVELPRHIRIVRVVDDLGHQDVEEITNLEGDQKPVVVQRGWSHRPA